MDLIFSRQLVTSTVLLVKLTGGKLKEVILAESVLGVAGVELQNVLDSVVALDVQREGFSAEEPGNILRAGRSGERAGVLVDTVRLQVSSQGSEIEVASHGVGAGSGNVVNVGEDGVEDGGGITELRQFEDKANNSNGIVYSSISILGTYCDGTSTCTYASIDRSSRE
jgi:hypothetical protein